MPEITDADRQAAKALRIALADVSGFWFHFDDDSALCQALAMHRLEAEHRAAERHAARGRLLDRPKISTLPMIVTDKAISPANLAA